jgi:hypothetical protein
MNMHHVLPHALPVEKDGSAFLYGKGVRDPAEGPESFDKDYGPDIRGNCASRQSGLV